MTQSINVPEPTTVSDMGWRLLAAEAFEAKADLLGLAVDQLALVHEMLEDDPRMNNPKQAVRGTAAALKTARADYRDAADRLRNPPSDGIGARVETEARGETG